MAQCSPSACYVRIIFLSRESTWKTFLTAWFSLRGNIIGEYPYKRGTPCSKCASGKGFCYKNLCSEYEFSGSCDDDFQGYWGWPFQIRNPLSSCLFQITPTAFCFTSPPSPFGAAWLSMALQHSKSICLEMVPGLRRRQRARVVSASDSQSSGPRFEFRFDHYLDLFHGSSEFKSSETLVNSQLVCLRPVGIQVDLFVSVVCSASLAFMP